MSFTDYYIYGMKARPFSVGCQPMEGLITSDAFKVLKMGLDEESQGYHSTLLYNRKLTEKELYDYELEFVGIRREIDYPNGFTDETSEGIKPQTLIYLDEADSKILVSLLKKILAFEGLRNTGILTPEDFWRLSDITENIGKQVWNEYPETN